MKIALVGYGKMGKLIEKIALSQGHSIEGKITLSSPDWTLLEPVDVVIDFSSSQAVLDTVKQCAYYNKNLVIGTTGWHDLLPQVKQIAQAAKIGIVYSPNFSIGVQSFFKLIAYAAKLMESRDEYDRAILEVHHKEKKDAPSGTALVMQKLLQAEITSSRVGSVTGEHHLLFDSAFDSITLSHKAKSREGFALGAITAAEWLLGKEGCYTFEDIC